MSLAIRQIATYREVTEYWDIDEIEAMREILDIQDDIEAEQAEQLKLKRSMAKK
jgi:hypothetical protein